MSLRAALRHQSRACASLGSPFNARLLGLIADRLQPGTALADRLLGWPGDISPRGASVPLRLAGALHGLVLDGAAPDLAAAYPPHDVGDDTLWLAVNAALHSHAARIDDWLNRPPQTNEVGRSAVLIALGHWLTARYGLPLILSELGASAGLNLMWDRYALDLPGARLGPDDAVLRLAPDWTGTTPVRATPAVADRRGTDLTPLDPADAKDRLRLSAYIWPDQTDRLTRTTAALAAARAPVDRADAANWLASRLCKPAMGHLHLICHTIAWQYFPPATQSRARAQIESAAAHATPTSPLAWFAMEADSNSPGAALTLRLWPGDLTLNMGRADFHGRWIDWQPPGDARN
jgi:hypothetical protein